MNDVKTIEFEEIKNILDKRICELKKNFDFRYRILNIFNLYILIICTKEEAFDYKLKKSEINKQSLEKVFTSVENRLNTFLKGEEQ